MKTKSYDSQAKWQKSHGYITFSFKTYRHVGDAIKNLAKQQGVSVSRLISNALEAQYGINLSKPERLHLKTNDTDNTINSENNFD